MRKDAGDDPDVTNGVRISAAVRRAAGGVTIDGGAGVGRVTKPGLSVPGGRGGDQPGPRAQIAAAVARAAREAGYAGGFSVILSAENGAALAKQTYNEASGRGGWHLDSGYERHRGTHERKGAGRYHPAGAGQPVRAGTAHRVLVSGKLRRGFRAGHAGPGAGARGQMLEFYRGRARPRGLPRLSGYPAGRPCGKAGQAGGRRDEHPLLGRGRAAGDLHRARGAVRGGTAIRSRR